MSMNCFVSNELGRGEKVRDARVLAPDFYHRYSFLRRRPKKPRDISILYRFMVLDVSSLKNYLPRDLVSYKTCQLTESPFFPLTSTDWRNS